MQVVQENAEIVRLRKALENDNRIVALRGNVRQAAEIKYENGTITTSELLQKITDESAALSAQALHRIELIKAQYELKNL
jgi:outer membrane protein TolC